MEKQDPMTLFKIMDTIGASEEMRQLYKDKARYYEIAYKLENDGKEVTYNFGSLSEGTTTPGLQSDYDIVTYSEDLPLVLTVEDAPKKGCAALLNLDTETAPGYVKVQLINGGLKVPENLVKKLEDSGRIKRDRRGICCLKNIQSLPDESLMLFHGPALTYTKHVNEPIDNVVSLRCKKWPSLANEWLARERNHSWPDRQTIDHCQRLGFFVVKVGHPNSKEKDIEWRTSFSFQERFLIFNLTEVQHKCYILLKLIKKDLIEGTIGKSITSYHCKTSIFYTIEQNPQSIWYPENLFECVKKCLELLLDWSIKGHCPNYFIPSENMLDGKVTGNKRIKLIDILNKLLGAGLSFIKKITTDNVGKLFMHRNDKYETDILENLSHRINSRTIYKTRINKILCVLDCVACLLYNRVYKNHMQETTKVKIATSNKVLRAIESHMQLKGWLDNIETINEYNKNETRDVIEILTPYLHSSLACHLLSFSLQCKNISLRNKYICLSEYSIKYGILSDVTSGRLKYATYLYKRGNYDLCQQELFSLEQKFTQHTISVSRFSRNLYDINCDLQRELEKHNYSTKYLLKHYVCAAVFFLPTELEVTPYALQFEMFRSFGTPSWTKIESLHFWQDFAFVDSKVYMYFLWYLLNREMDVSQQESFDIFKRLESSVKDSQWHVETAYNIFAWVLNLEFLIPQAIGYLVLSWRDIGINNVTYDHIIPNEYLATHNAAQWHMLILLKQIWCSKRLSDQADEVIPFCFRCFKQYFRMLPTCPSCKIAQYCSKKCQKNDWVVQKKNMRGG